MTADSVIKTNILLYFLENVERRSSGENSENNFETKLKFEYSEKATQFEKIFHLKFDATQWRQILSGNFYSNFMAF